MEFCSSRKSFYDQQKSNNLNNGENVYNSGLKNEAICNGNKDSHLDKIFAERAAAMRHLFEVSLQQRRDDEKTFIGQLTLQEEEYSERLAIVEQNEHAFFSLIERIVNHFGETFVRFSDFPSAEILVSNEVRAAVKSRSSKADYKEWLNGCGSDAGAAAIGHSALAVEQLRGTSNKTVGRTNMTKGFISGLSQSLERHYSTLEPNSSATHWPTDSLCTERCWDITNYANKSNSGRTGNSFGFSSYEPMLQREPSQPKKNKFVASAAVESERYRKIFATHAVLKGWEAAGPMVRLREENKRKDIEAVAARRFQHLNNEDAAAETRDNLLDREIGRQQFHEEQARIKEEAIARREREEERKKQEESFNVARACVVIFERKERDEIIKEWESIAVPELEELKREAETVYTDTAKEMCNSRCSKANDNNDKKEHCAKVEKKKSSLNRRSRNGGSIFESKDAKSICGKGRYVIKKKTASAK